MTRAGLKQSELARAAGVSDGAVSQWLKGTTKPTTDNQMRIASACGVSFGEFVTGELAVVEVEAAAG